MFVYLVSVHMPAATCIRGRIEAAWKIYSERPNRSAVCDGNGLHLQDIWHVITFALHHLWYLKQAAAPRGGCEIDLLLHAFADLFRARSGKCRD